MPPPPSMPPKPPPPPSIIWLIIGPMVCINMPKRRLPILAFIISSIGAIWVIMSPPPPPPKPPNWALAGADVRVNSSSTVAAWQTTLSAPVMVFAPRVRSSAVSGANRTHAARLETDGSAFCEKDHVGAGALRRVAPQCLLHRQRGLIHLAIDVRRDFIGQHIDDPDQPGAAVAIGYHLHRRAVLFDE